MQKKKRKISPHTLRMAEYFEKDIKRMMEPFFATQKQINFYVDTSTIRQFQKVAQNFYDNGPLKQIEAQSRALTESFKFLSPYSPTAESVVRGHKKETLDIDKKIIERIEAEIKASLKKELETGSTDDRYKRVTLLFNDDGDIFRDSVHSQLKMKVRSDQYLRLLHLFVEEHRYVTAAVIAKKVGYNTEHGAQSAIGTFRRRLVGVLKLPMKKPIEGNKGKGYRIHPAITLIPIDRSKKS